MGSSLVYVSKSMPAASKIAASSSNVMTKSTSERTVRRIASSFFAAHGPTKMTRASGILCLTERAVATMGVRALETLSTMSGNCVFASMLHAGQQEVRRKGSLPVTTSVA